MECFYGESGIDILVDASGAAQGLAALERYNRNLNSAIKGVVKAKYVENGNTDLQCTGVVELAIDNENRMRRLEAKKNARFTYDASAMERTRDLQEDKAKFGVGIKLDPGSSSAASAINSATLMGLMAAAAGIVIALI